eukprot:6185820-Pleurochrysis_carterae.AAC.2
MHPSHRTCRAPRACAALFERVHVADEVHLDADGELAADAAQRVVERVPALYGVGLVEQRVQVDEQRADVVVRRHNVSVPALDHQRVVLQVAVVGNLDPELLK